MKGIEPLASMLSAWRSATELHAHIKSILPKKLGDVHKQKKQGRAEARPWMNCVLPEAELIMRKLEKSRKRTVGRKKRSRIEEQQEKGPTGE